MVYLPRSFKVEDLTVLHDLMRTHSFATLFSQWAGTSVASHLPFMIDPTEGPNGTLIAHFARANEHWMHFEEGAEALVVFQGPHAYISPAWYEDQATVPTWNYAVVHAYGRPVLIHDAGRLRDMVLRLVGLHEGRAGTSWDVSRADPVMERELKAIVGFEMEIGRIEGKFKFNQNRSQADRVGVVANLGHSSNPTERAVADIMSASLDTEPLNSSEPDGK